ncbi:MFS transporter [Nocardioides sp. NPDC051685]|uniref:MFS transporter n=1 Tax=Nocardioides sp. NPDC051685 TaxID=3364334 RepID=UPI0037A55699
MAFDSQVADVEDPLPVGPGSRRRWLAVMVVCVGVMMSFVNVSSTLSALTFIQRDLHLSGPTLIWVSSAFPLAMVSLLMSAGTFGELYGRRRTYFAGVVLVGVGSLVAFLATSAGALITGQAVMGVGAAAAMPTGLSIVSNTFPDQHERVRAIGVWASTAGIGLTVGPLVSGALLDNFSWHVAYLSNVFLALVGAALVPAFITEGRHPSRRLDPIGVVLGSVTIAALAFAIIEGGSRGNASVSSIAAYLIVAVSLPAFVVVELRHRDPMLDLRLFRSASFTVIQLVAAAAMFGFVGVSLLAILYLQRVAHLDAWSTGVHMLPWMLSYVVVSAVAARVVGALGFAATLTVGLLLMGVGALALLRVGIVDGYGAMWPALLAMGIGSALLIGPSTAAAVNSVSSLQAGMASAAVNTFRQFGSMLGASILGTIATTQFPRHLTRDLAEAGVSPDVADGAVAAAVRGIRPEVTVSLRPLLDQAVPEAFTSALHLGFAVGGITLLVVAIPTAVFVRQR